jgi:hypothetical protein
MGLGVATAEMIGEGPAPTPAQTILVFTVFTTIEAVVTLIGTLLLGRWLGVLGRLRGRVA